MSGSRPPNRLAGETSPYLLQHSRNPVDWFPWGPEAIARARREDKPIFLSIGYAACHWCHVMERESFEDEGIASFLNERFVPVKVDREERPDLDEIYMAAVQLVTGHGGWPLSVFLTPAREPFFGGTYWPPDDRGGRPGFATVLRLVDEAWRTRRGDIAAAAAELTARIRDMDAAAQASENAPLGRRDEALAVAQLAGRFDPRWGGFGAAPKFPPHGAIGLLLRQHARTGDRVPLEMATTTLDRMAQGGLYDQIGGGFSRYSVDERWLVPHFEKMLYDQALLVPVYVDAWLLTRRPLYRRVVEDTLDFVRRELTDPAGGFWSSLDADSAGHEGAFYVWTPDEVVEVLGRADADVFCKAYGISSEGNFEGKSIPNLLDGDVAEPALAAMRDRLLAARAARPRPATDDKVLTAWNGLMITAFCRAWQALGRPEDLASARRAADFAMSALRPDGRLRAVWRDGSARLNAYLDDHAFLARGLVDLYESSFDRRDLEHAADLAREIVARFGAPDGGFHFTSDDHEPLLSRTTSRHDGALPAGAGVGAEAMMRLAIHLDDPALRQAAVRALAAIRPLAASAPSAFTAHLAAASYLEGPVHEIAIVGPEDDPRTAALLAATRGRYVPDRVVARAGPLLAGKGLVAGAPAAYVCRAGTCSAPVTDPEGLLALLPA